VTLYIFMLTVIYGIAFFSNHAWGDTMTFGLLWSFLRHDGHVWQKIYTSMPSTLALLLGVGVFICIQFLIYRSAFKCLSICGEYWSTKSNKYRRMLVGTIPCLAVALGLSAQWTPDYFRGEPVLGTFFGWPSYVDIAGMDRFRREALIRDEIARSNYPWDSLPNQKNVIILMFDSLRADHLPLYGYKRETTPFLSSLWQRGELHAVKMATSTCSESFCGVASTLTSHAYHQIAPGNLRMHEILRRLGYEVTLLLTGNHRDWAGLKEMYGSEVDHWYDYITGGTNMHDDLAIIKGLDKIPSAPAKPSFIFSFLMSTHVLGERMPEYRRFLPDDLGKHLSLWSSPSLSQNYKKVTGAEFSAGSLDAVINNYDNGVLQADGMVRLFFEQLGQKGYLDNAIVVIMGDHGDSLGEHDHLGHNRYLYQENIRIPILIWSSDNKIPQNLEFASQIDIAPTILDYLGLPIPETFVGKSLYSENRNHTSVHQTRRGKQPCAASMLEQHNDLWKMIACVQENGALKESLFRLSQDPMETMDVLAATEKNDAAVVAALRAPLSYFRTKVINTCTTMDCVE
jgi:glucan phosphoethanolaminetransferase (alkaline phosphatase superfamily)